MQVGHGTAAVIWLTRYNRVSAQFAPYRGDGMGRFFYYFFMAGMACESAYANTIPDEQAYLQELPVVLSASRLSQPVSETPNAMTVMDRDMIEASGARNIAELFRLVPGMYVGYENGNIPIVSYRGTTDAYARRMQVLVDGRTVYMPYIGQVDWAELPLDIGDIERIEVVRGPSAASHGSNSVQGVISITTRPASAYRNVQVSAARGDAGISDVSARFGHAGNDWDYRLTLASNADGGYASFNDDNAIKLVNMRANYRPAGSDSIDVQLGYSDSTRGDGKTGITPNDMDTLRDRKADTSFQQLNWLHTLHEGNDVQFSYYHILRRVRDNRNNGLGFPIIDEAAIHRHDLELQQTLNISSTNRLVWGLGMRRDSVDSPSTFSAPVTWREYRLFAHDEWRVTPDSILNIGAMTERNGLDQTRVSPRVAYNYHLSSRHTLRASASVAYRNPEMIEELGNRRFLVAPGMWEQEYKSAGGLSPERAFSREVGYIGQLDDAGSTLDIRLYHDRISDIIWVDPISLQPTLNLKSLFTATYKGLEATLNYRFAERSKLTANYSYQDVSAVAAGYPTSPLLVSAAKFQGYVDRYARTVPQSSGSLLFAHEFSGGMQAGVGFYYQDKVQVLDRTEWQSPMQRLDLRLAKRFGARKSSGNSEIALVVQNALNDHYLDYKPEIVGKRRSYLSVKLEF